MLQNLRDKPDRLLHLVEPRPGEWQGFQMQLHRYSEAVEYLQNRGLQDPDLIAELGLLPMPYQDVAPIGALFFFHLHATTPLA